MVTKTNYPLSIFAFLLTVRRAFFGSTDQLIVYKTEQQVQGF